MDQDPPAANGDEANILKLIKAVLLFYPTLTSCPRVRPCNDPSSVFIGRKISPTPVKPYNWPSPAVKFSARRARSARVYISRGETVLVRETRKSLLQLRGTRARGRNSRIMHSPTLAVNFHAGSVQNPSPQIRKIEYRTIWSISTAVVYCHQLWPHCCNSQTRTRIASIFNNVTPE